MHFLKENFNPEWNFNGDAAGNVNCGGEHGISHEVAENAFIFCINCESEKCSCNESQGNCRRKENCRFCTIYVIHD